MAASRCTAGAQRFLQLLSESWLEQLSIDPESEALYPNKKMREVKSGHYVLVPPTPLPEAELLIYSKDFVHGELFTDTTASSYVPFKDEWFLRFFSGGGFTSDAPAGSQTVPRSWATPYALSIYGEQIYQNCPFGNGNGYGDGRAISIAEIVVPETSRRWEFQLKGSGTTPFSRRADGRAVLRSSIREFLASEAMHHLGVSTTRALSLFVSKSETVQRPWFSGRTAARDPRMPTDVHDPRLAQFPLQIRKAILMQIQGEQREPDVMNHEACAITCRVAPSFLRVGHIELFARRAAKLKTEETRQQLEQIVRHAIFREYPEIDRDASLDIQIKSFLELFTERLSLLIAHWLRVGYTQGNFNSDNCLVAGRTMDYGPFGYIEKYDPDWNMWTGGGQHFSFMNQPKAAARNFESLANSLRPLLPTDEGQAIIDNSVQAFSDKCAAIVQQMWGRKLGLHTAWDKGTSRVFSNLELLMRTTPIDYTVLWRQLAEIPSFLIRDWRNKSAVELLEPLLPAFFEPQGLQEATTAKMWNDWLRSYLELLESELRLPDEIRADMKRESPKYIPREWMLVEAYSTAQLGDYAMLNELHELFLNPYAEQPHYEAKYYHLTPQTLLSRPGTAFMSCSS